MSDENKGRTDGITPEQAAQAVGGTRQEAIEKAKKLQELADSEDNEN
jgi:hypothetical protein